MANFCVQYGNNTLLVFNHPQSPVLAQQGVTIHLLKAHQSENFPAEDDTQKEFFFLQGCDG